MYIYIYIYIYICIYIYIYIYIRYYSILNYCILMIPLLTTIIINYNVLLTVKLCIYDVLYVSRYVYELHIRAYSHVV